MSLDKANLILSVILLLWGYSGKTQSGSPIIDSLTKVFHTHKKDDSTKIDLLNELAYAYVTFDVQKGLIYAKKALQLSVQLNDRKREAASYAHYGQLYSVLGKDSIALIQYQKALNIHNQLHNNKSVATTLHNIGLVYNGQSQYKKAILYHQQALNILKKLKDSSRMLIAQNSIGVNYMYLADYPKALQTFFEVTLLAEKYNSNLQLANGYTNIGIIYKKTANYEKAQTFHQKAHTIFQDLGNKEGMANALGNLGVTSDAQNNYLEATQYYTRAFAIGNEIGNKRIVASNLTNLASTYKSQKSYKIALVNLEKAEKFYQELKDNNNLSAVLNQTAEIYAIGSQYKRAIALHSQALTLAIESEDKNQQCDILASLVNTYKLSGDFKNALQSYEKQIDIRDSIMSNENAHNMGRSEANYENEIKTVVMQATHAAQISQQKNQRSFLLAGIGLITISGGAAFWSYKRRQDAKTKQKAAEQNAQMADTQLQVMRLQMNPHFIFNSLHSVMDYMRGHNVEEAELYLAQFAKAMRMILENSEQQFVSLGEDLKALTLYLQLEAKRLKNKFTYNIVVDDSIEQDNTYVPPLIFQPIIENSIWHGISAKQGNGNIFLHIEKVGETLKCTIDDDGIGRTQSAKQYVSTKQSMGLNITKSRIEMLNRNMTKGLSSIQFIDKEQGLTTVLILPIIRTF